MDLFLFWDEAEEEIYSVGSLRKRQHITRYLMTVSWPVCSGMRPPSGTRNQFFFLTLGISPDNCSFAFLIMGCPL
jgi:hypothetical protein